MTDEQATEPSETAIRLANAVHAAQIGPAWSSDKAAHLIDAALNEAKREAWERGWGDAIDQAPDDVWFDEWHYQCNPYRENGAEHD